MIGVCQQRPERGGQGGAGPSGDDDKSGEHGKCGDGDVVMVTW